MRDLKNNSWTQWLSRIEFAFQPIVNAHTGACYGYEALMRNYNSGGFTSPADLLDQAFRDNALYQVDMAMQKKAIQRFAGILKQKEIKLFFNLDNRVLDRQSENMFTPALLKQYGLRHETFCFEMSDRNGAGYPDKAAGMLKAYRSEGFRIAVDGYGTGTSGHQILYCLEPDFIKIDRFFIREIEKDSKKRLFVSNIVDIAHYLGSVVIAVGVETKEACKVCRDIGCDMVQGYLIQKPEIGMKRFRNQYRHNLLEEGRKNGYRSPYHGQRCHYETPRPAPPWLLCKRNHPFFRAVDGKSQTRA